MPLFHCPLGAVHYEAEGCIGCGLCVPTCDFDAMTLSEINRAERFIPPRNTAATFINLARDRGLI